jgi:hypothetical protein
MTDSEIVQDRFMDFLFQEIEFLTRHRDVSKQDAARIAVDVCFASMLRVLENAYGHKRLAEDFYQLADKMVEKSNESGT